VIRVKKTYNIKKSISGLLVKDTVLLQHLFNNKLK